VDFALYYMRLEQVPGTSKDMHIGHSFATA